MGTVERVVAHTSLNATFLSKLTRKIPSRHWLSVVTTRWTTLWHDKKKDCGDGVVLRAPIGQNMGRKSGIRSFAPRTFRRLCRRGDAHLFAVQRKCASAHQLARDVGTSFLDFRVDRRSSFAETTLSRQIF